MTVGTGVCGVVSALVLSGARGERWLADRIEGAVEGLTVGGDLRIGDLSLGRRGIVLTDIELLDASGANLLTARRAAASLDVEALIWRQAVVVPTLRVDDVVVEARADEAGVLDWARLMKPSEGGGGFELPVDVDIAALEVEGVIVRSRSLLGTSLELVGGSLSGTLEGRGDRVSLHRAAVSGQLATPGPLPFLATGDLAYDGQEGLILEGTRLAVPRGEVVAVGALGETLALGVTVERVEARALDPLVADLGLGGVWGGSLYLEGPRSRTEVVVALRGLEGSAGAATITGMLDLAGEVPTWSLAAHLDHLHVEDLYTPLTQETVLEGVIRVDGRGTSPSTDLSLDGTWSGRDLVLAELPVDSLEAAFGVSGGALRIRRADVDGILGEMAIEGEIDLTGGGMELTVESPLDPGRLADLGSPGLDGEGRVVASIETRPGDRTVYVAGTARYAPFRYQADVRMDALVAPFHATLLDGRLEGSADLDGSGLLAYGVGVSQLSARDLRFSRDPAGTLQVDGGVGLTNVHYGSLGSFSSIDASLGVTMRGGHRSIAVEGQAGPWSVVDLPGDGGRIVAHIEDDAVDFDVALTDGERPMAVLLGTHDLASSRLVVGHLALSPTRRTTWANQGPVTGTVVGGGMADLQLDLRSELGRLEVRGDVGTEGPLDATVRVEGLQLDHLTELWPDKVDLAGELDLRLALSGTGEDPVVDGTVDLRGLFANGSVRWLDVAGPLRWSDGRLTPDLALGMAGRPLGHLSGSLPLEGGLADAAPALDGPLDLALSLVPGDLQRFAHLSPSLDGQTLPEGQLSGVLRATGPMRDPDVHLAGVAELAVEGWSRPGRVEFELDRRDDRLVFDGDLREDLALRATVFGDGLTRMGEVFAATFGTGPAVELSDPELWLDGMDVSTALVGVPVASVASAAHLPVVVGGELVGGIAVHGSPMRPTVEGAVNWIDASLGSQAIEGAYAALVPGERGYDLDLSATFPGGDTFAATGALPIHLDLAEELEQWTEGELDLTVDGAIPLALLSGFDPEIRDAKGRLLVQGKVGGGLHDPDPHLVITGDGLAASYRTMGIRTEDPELRLELTRDAVSLDVKAPLQASRRLQQLPDTLGASLGDPRVALSGRVGLKDWAPVDILADVSFRDGAWLIATELTKLRWNGDVHLAGPWDGPTVTGDLDLVQGQVGLEAATFVDASTLGLDPSVAVTRPNAEVVAPSAIEPPFYAVFDVDVGVHLNRNLDLSMSIPFVDDLGGIGAAVARVDVATRLGGDVQLSLQQAEPRLVGEVELIDDEGSVRMMRANFGIDRGSITFAGGDPYESAELDVEATMQVSGGSLGLHLTGTPIAPEFAFSSEQFPDPNEQMVVLLTGTAPDQLTSDEGAGAVALAMLLWSSVTSGTRLGSFSIEPDGSVRLGIPVSRSVHASSTWSVFSDPTQNSFSFEVDWSLAPKLVFNGGVGNRVSWGDIYWEIRF
ncbi:MAG: translocation/assembly module TamB domain-containing protein [Alphaproteobacteria bacterium]|nr:translocation/assembly module TamB domain-containing protein [Alphaproteobacteria bacterium]MCB9699779.1 translocation/assembly module TamB domain-containing protein [Alphaproteobacteria bacterium]